MNIDQTKLTDLHVKRASSLLFFLFIYWIILLFCSLCTVQRRGAEDGNDLALCTRESGLVFMTFLLLSVT